MLSRLLLRLLISFPAVFLISLPAVPNAIAENSEPLSVGIIIPLSGSTASLGNYLKNGIDLAYSELSSDLQGKIDLHFEDDQLQATKSVSAFKKLRSLNSIDAALVLGSGVGNAVGPLAESSSTVLIAVGASDPKVAEGRKFAFTHWVTPEVEVEVMLDEMERRDYKRIGFIGAEQEGVIALYNVIIAQLEARGMTDKLLLDQKYLPAETNYRDYIAKAKAKKLDAVIVCLFPGAISSFTKQSKQLGFKAAFAGIELFEDESEVKASEGTLIGHWYVNADEATGDFVRRYKARYNEHPGWGAANAYDSLMLLAKGYQELGRDSTAIARMLRELKNYTGAAGTYSASGDNRFILPATIKVVTENGFEKLN